MNNRKIDGLWSYRFVEYPIECSDCGGGPDICIRCFASKLVRRYTPAANGHRKPWYIGFVCEDRLRDETIYAVIPLNLVLRWIYNTWRWCCRRPAAEYSQQVFLKGYKAGYNRGCEAGRDLALQLTHLAGSPQSTAADITAEEIVRKWKEAYPKLAKFIKEKKLKEDQPK